MKSGPMPTRASVLLVIFWFACAFALNGVAHYSTIMTALAIAGAVLAAYDTQASLILVAAAPALDSYGILITEPQVVTVFQVVLIAGVLGFAFRFARAREWSRSWLTLWDAGILVFLMAVVLSVPASHARVRSVIGAIEIAALTALYLLFSRAVPPERSSRRIRLTVVAVGTLSALVAIGQAFVPGFPVPLLETHHTGSTLVPLRVSAFFANPNSAAALLVLSAVVAVELMLTGASWRARVGWAAAALVSAMSVALTFSREGIIGLIVGVVAVIIMTSRGLKTLAISLAVVLLVALAIFTAPGVGQRARSIYGFANDPSALDRVYLTQVSLKMFADHPATGIGMSAFAATYPGYADPRVTVSPVTDGHQTIFSIPAENGFLGLVAELVTLAALTCLVFASRAIARLGVSVAGIAAACAFLAMAFFNVFYYAEYAWVALALAGLAARSTSIGVLYQAPSGWLGPRCVPTLGEEVAR